MNLLTSSMYRQSDRGNHWRKTEGYSRSFLETTERSQDEYEDPRGSQRNYPKDHMGRGYGRPPGLRGKDIGLYYARKHKEKMNNPDGITRHRKRKVMMKLTLDQRRMDRIQEMLRSIKTPYLRGIEQSEIKKTEGGSGNSSDSPFLSAIENVSKSPFLSAIENVSKSPFLSANENVSNVEAKYAHLGQSRFKDNFLQNITGSIQTKLEQATTMRTQLPRCPDTDRSLKDMLMGKKENSKKYQEMLKFRKKLPSYDKEQEILNLIRNNQVILISGETGCGKTTQVAQFILDDYIMRGDGSLCHVVCTQPRRISAISVACRVADERDETIGSQSVGYQIRLELSIPPSKKGSILYCTTGILLQWMRTDPALLEVSHLVLDEIHERDVLSDFVLTILKDVLPKRPDLKVILMSATLNSEQFSKYYNNCPSINIPGFTYPVEELYLEDVLQITGFNFPPPQQPMHGWQRHLKKNKRKNQESDDYYNFIEPHVRQMQRENKYSQSVINGIRNPESEVLNVDLIVSLIKHICFNKEPGAILVFIPGWTDITKLHSALQESGQFPEHKYLIIPLHSMMPTLVQRSVFDRPPPGVRKIVIATNIAETSITIDDVVYVIDCGKIKMKNFDAVNNIATLKAEWVSLANARQRRGRAGRVQPGVCYHLYSRAREMTLDSYPLPEMLRTRLEEVILQLKILQLGMTEPFLKRVIDPPQPNVVHLSLKLLRNLNALDDNENLTPLGYHLARLPLDPQIGKMILMSSIFSCIDPIFSIAACLSFKDPFYIPLGKEKEVTRRKKSFAEGLKSDHLVLAEVMSKWEEERYRRNDNNFCYQNFLSRSTLNMINDMKQQFARYLHEMNFLKDSNVKSPEANVNSNNLSLVKAVVCSGLYPNVAIIRSAKRNLKTGRSRINIHTPEDGRVQIHPKSVNETEHEFESPFLLYYEKLQTMSKNLLDTGMVYPLPLLFFGQGVTYSVEDGHGVVAVNDSIAFNSCESNANIIKDLRLRLDRLLEYKITHPGCVNWRAENEEAALLRAIIELITIEEQMIIGTGTDDDDLDDFSD